jgi:hypothetical protein
MEENEQDQALAKLKSHSYFQGSHDIYRYTDNFEELAIMAGYSDTHPGHQVLLWPQSTDQPRDCDI